MAFDLGYSIESVLALMERFTQHHQLIRYNTETRELAIKNWAKYNLHKGGKPIMDCIYSELKEVEDTSLIQYVSESILKEEIQSLFDSFCGQEEMLVDEEDREQDESMIYIVDDCVQLDDSRFLQPGEIILKVMNSACPNNKRRLNYVVGILKNWENENLLTVEEIDTYQEKQRPIQRQATLPISSGRYIPRGVNLDFAACEEE